jgi:UDP-N-acetylmuramyl pentapeptide phosphotransferase/UDP-N-acetylglucosamine-1-phosphate transferase
MPLDNELLRVSNDVLDKHIHPAYQAISQSWIDHKIALLKDYSTIGSLLLGALAIFVNQKKDLPSPNLFYFGLILISIMILVNFVLQRKYFSEEDRLAEKIRKSMHTLIHHIVAYSATGGTAEKEALATFLKQESNLPSNGPPGLFQKHGELIVFGLFSIGFVSVLIALLFNVPKCCG